MTDPIEDSLNQAKQPQAQPQKPQQPQGPSLDVEEALKQSQPQSQGGMLDTASHLANYYYGAAKTESSKVLSAFSVGFQDKWGANQHQIDADVKKELAANKHPDSGNYLTHYENAIDTGWKNWSTIARQGLAEYGNYAWSANAGVLKALDQMTGDIGKLPSEAELLKIGYKPEDIHNAYAMVRNSGVGPVGKAIVHGAERGAAPAAGALWAGVKGAELGAAAGAAIPVLGETGIGEAGGAIVGGLTGGIVGYQGVQKAQEYLMSKLPEKWQEMLGQSQKQQQREQIKHPTATFAGELLPFTASFQPGLAAKAVGPNASMFMKALAHPLGQRAVSGILMGDWEAVQELWNEGKTDSDKVAIAAAIGTFFPRSEAAEKIKILNENSNNPRIEPTFTSAKANGLIGSTATKEQIQAKTEAVGSLPPHEVVNPREIIEGPHSTEEAIHQVASKDYKIATEAGKQLVKAGRSPDEASALGVLVQHYFETRSARFRGSIGTPEELFQKEFPEIVRMEKAPQAGKGELSQDEAETEDEGFKTNPAKIAQEHQAEVLQLEREGSEAAAKKIPHEDLRQREFNQDETKEPFYSALSKGVEDLKQSKAPADQWLQTIRNLKGVKKEELDWSGLEDFLKEHSGPIKKSEITEYLDEHKINLQEHEKSDSPLTHDEFHEWQTLTAIPASERTDEEWQRVNHLMDKLRKPDTNKTTKFSQYVLPGGKNYREMLLALPERDNVTREKTKNPPGWGGGPNNDEGFVEHGDTGADFRGSHWDEPNVLAHVRFDTRLIPNPDKGFRQPVFLKVLHMAELQSDWHQKGRRMGYAPTKEEAAEEDRVISQLKEKVSGEAARATINPIFKKLGNLGFDLLSEAKASYAREPDAWDLTGITDEEHDALRKWGNASRAYHQALDNKIKSGIIPNAPFKTSWHELAMKRMLRYAAEHGYDRLSWDTGETNADRFDLSHQVSNISYDTRENKLRVYDLNANLILDQIVPADKLDDHIGKEAADKIKEKINKNELTHYGDAVLEKPDLKVGGEGMKGFYDKILPDFTRKYTKKWGAKVEDMPLKTHTSDGTSVTMGELQEHGLRNHPFTIEHQLDAINAGSENGPVRVRDTRTDQLSDEMSYDEAHGYIEQKLKDLTAKTVPVHSVTITPEMRDSVLQGQPLFQRGRRGSLAIRTGKNLLKLFQGADASTVLHELAHDWLEAFHKDSQHPEAPDELVNDLKTVRDWYNKTRGRGQEWVEGSVIPKAAHERWARGFERYLMEGQAPSRGLAAVFAKFKAWLTKIYKSVDKLRAPINDDVRGVFDRLLSTAPTKTIIDPMSDVETPSEPAGSPPEALPQDSGTGIPQGPNASPEALQKVSELNQPGIVDKDGNFRVKQITGYDDLARGVKQWITKNANKILAEKDNVTPEAVQNYASSLGLSPKDGKASLEKLHGLFGGPDVPLSGKMYAVGQYLKDSTTHLSETLINGTKEDILLARHQLLGAMRTFETARTDWGYTGLALQQLYREADKAGALDQFFQSVIGKDDKEFSQEILRMKDLAQKKGISVEELIKQQRAEANPKLGGVISEFFRGNLLTGLFTHTFYAEFNKVWALYRLYPTTAFQAATSSGMQALSNITRTLRGKPLVNLDKVRWGELRQISYDFKHAQADALRSMGDSFKAGRSLGMTIERVAAQKVAYEVENGITKPEDTQARIDYLVKNPTEEMRVKAAPPKNILQSGVIKGNVNIFGKTINLDTAGSIVRVGGERMAAPLHSEAYVFMQQLKLSSLIYREAANKGLTGNALAAEVARMKYDTPLDLLQQSRVEALKATNLSSQSKLAQYLTGVSRLKLGSQEWQPLVQAEPFIGVAADIFHTAVFDATPAGLLTKEIRQNALGKNGSVKQAEAVGNLMIGTALLGTVYAWMKSGTFNGPPPVGKKAARTAQMSTGYPYSFKIGNQSIAADRMGILGTAISLSSDLIRAFDYVKKGDTKFNELMQLSWGILHTVGQHMLEGIGPFSGFTRIFDAERDQSAFEQWITKTGALFEPGSIFLNQIDKETDPYLRDTRATTYFQTFVNQLKAQTPGLSETLPARIDIWGQPIPNEKFIGVYLRQIENDKVMQYFDRNPSMFPAQARQPNKFKLSEEQLHEYQMKSGLYLKQALNDLITPDFESFSQKSQHNMIQMQVTMARQKAMSEIQPKDPGLLQQQIQTMKDSFK